MTRSARWLFVLLSSSAAIGAAACGSGSAPKATPPAKVANPVKEADLTTITLTPEAERRLGIETAVLASRPAAGARQVGGEVLVPPGRVVPMTAPATGRVEAGDVGALGRRPGEAGPGRAAAHAARGAAARPARELRGRRRGGKGPARRRQAAARPRPPTAQGPRRKPEGRRAGASRTTPRRRPPSTPRRPACRASRTGRSTPT